MSNFCFAPILEYSLRILWCLMAHGVDYRRRHPLRIAYSPALGYRQRLSRHQRFGRIFSTSAEDGALALHYCRRNIDNDFTKVLTTFLVTEGIS